MSERAQFSECLEVPAAEPCEVVAPQIEAFTDSVPSALRRWGHLCGAYRACWHAARGARSKLALSRYALEKLASEAGLPLSLREEVTLELAGLKFTIHTGQGELNLFREIFVARAYDALPDFALRRDWCVLDVGANVGFFSLKAAAACVNGRVYAFEPNVTSYQALARNLAQNSLGNVAAVQKAVGRASGVARYVPTHCSPTGHLADSPGAGEGIAVEVISLDEFVTRNPIDAIHLLKIDVEGAEADVLRGAEAVLFRVERVAMEYHGQARLEECRHILAAHSIHLISRRPPAYAYFAAARRTP